MSQTQIKFLLTYCILFHYTLQHNYLKATRKTQEKISINKHYKTTLLANMSHVTHLMPVIEIFTAKTKIIKKTPELDISILSTAFLLVKTLQ